uniref:ATP-dependent clpX-like chaperone zinc ribbon domain-containing protein n=1 Tax=Schistosoma haematobium TaxID=6185 RepID=A0A094ZHK6_SCHHA
MSNFASSAFSCAFKSWKTHGRGLLSKSQNPGGPSEGSGSLNSANVNHHSIGSKERLGGAGGGGSGNGTGSFIRCNKCGGPLKSLDPKASYISRFMECEACEQLYELTDKSDLSSFSNVDESRHLSLVSPKEASHSLCKYVVFLIPCLLLITSFVFTVFSVYDAIVAIYCSRISSGLFLYFVYHSS